MAALAARAGCSLRAQSSPRPAQPKAHAQQTRSNNYTFHPKGPGPHRGDWLRKYMALAAAASRNSSCSTIPAFRSLPPEKQNHLLDRLRNFNSQPPEKKAQILNRMETFEHMTPQQQQRRATCSTAIAVLPEDQKD